MSFVDQAQKILRQVSPQWISLLLDLIESIQAYVKQTSPEGLYEFLNYEFELELLDVEGRTAQLTKHARVKFLQNNVIAFEDYAWGDGNVLVEYACSPGYVVDRYREGERWNILISLRESKNRNDVQDFYIESQLKNSLRAKEEWCQIEMQHRTRFAKIAIIFPKRRHCRQAVIIERKRNRTTHLDARNFTVLADGRQRLAWENIEPRRFETYTIKWTW